MGDVTAPPRGSLLIWCRTCGGERPAVKRHGPLPGTKRCAFVWWNVCCVCDTHFVALPPGITERHRVRMYERRSGQQLLLEG